ncbi:DUF4012 domain-containing protein [Bifidobacterium tibiigranuli]|uniref:DUF4012 domain-containing protein n=1 Tax=Bifidobacterium tibiigranuli TaxID=2172043 RepID=UPI0026EDF439|nr:DUF4012 domain-containing protein [Bifidobacterium tibiigranuli]MCI1650098.1 DUF4012 domain-containing protein [Bifidobacterium tibiigranuli]MCI2186135.1 DUF4012 domain-containing protein [Bifidobacterium tibiigranuli]MCI2204180.1 DUF4012 domain-containing protein [Bifidobacterium tibiigranuli]
MASSRHAGHRQQARKRRIWPWVTAVIVVLLALIATAGVLGLKFYSEAKQVKAHEEKALQMAGAFANVADADAAQKLSSQLPAIQKETGAAKNITQGRLWKFASKLPVVGGDVTTVQGMTGVVDSIMTDPLPKLVNAVSGLKNAQLSGEGGQLNLQPIAGAQQSLEQADSSLQTQVSRYKSLPQPRIGMVKDAYEAGGKNLEPIAQKVNQISSLMKFIPSFLGADHPRTYLLAAMSPSEMRSSGGLIGSVGVVTTDQGKITVGDFRSNKEYEPYGAADPTNDEWRIFNQWGPLHMSQDIRDSAMYPDTQRSAEGMRAIWQRSPWGADKPLDGVMLVDPVVLQQLNGVNGGVIMPDGQVLDGGNTAEFLLNTIYKNYPVSVQDAYFQAVAEQSVGGMFSNMDVPKLTKIAAVMSDMAKQRHFSMYDFDPQMQQTLDGSGLTAHAPSSEEHPAVGVYVNEQHASKLGWYVHRTSTITRLSCNADGSQTYTVQYTFTNTLTDSDMASLPAYILGGKQAQLMPGSAMEKTLLYAPAGGSIANLNIRGDSSDLRKETMNGKAVQAFNVLLKPGEKAIASFDVTTSKKSVSDLTLDQTPMGWVDPGVTIDTSACKIGK